jgi:hypothetical protein
VRLTAISFLFCFRKDGRWDLRAGKKSLRFFTILSNLFCAVSALLWVLSSSYWAWLLKYVGTVAMTVTLLTVIFFLGPNMGYKPLFSGKDLYLGRPFSRASLSYSRAFDSIYKQQTWKRKRL